MATIGAKIKTAIIEADHTSIRELLTTLDVPQVREYLDNKIDGEDLISLALRLGYRQIGLELLLHCLFEIDEWPHTIEQFTWLKLFGKATITKLQEILKYAKPFAINGDIDLKSLAKNLKYLKVAYLLGAPCQEGKLLGDLILDAHKDLVIGKQRFSDLVNSKICRRFPLSVFKTARYFYRDYDYILDLLKNYPYWFEDTDEHGNNILHCSLLIDQFSTAPFTYVWPIRSELVTTEKRISLILQKNDKGQTPLALFLQKVYTRIPVEFYLAIKQLVDLGDTKIINDILAIPDLYKKAHRDDVISVKIFLHAFFIQNGYSTESKKALKELAKIQDIGLFLHHFDKKGNVDEPENPIQEPQELQELQEPQELKTSEKISIMTRVKAYLSPIKLATPYTTPVAIPPPYISNVSLEDLPTELIILVAESLSPSGLFNFALCNKQLKRQLKKSINACEQLKLCSAWYHNKYSTITLPNDYESVAMDENWLVMSDQNLQYCYWNCTTHEIIESNVTRIHSAAAHTILSNYTSNSLPTLFDGRNIIRGNQISPLNSYIELRGIMYNKTIPIDHRVLLQLGSPHWNSVVVNTDIDCIERRLDQMCWYNSFHGTFLSYDNRAQFHVTDLRGDKTMSHDTDLVCSNPEFCFADEHTMFYFDSMGAGFIDLRNFKTIYSMSLPSYGINTTYSKERAILVADSQLVASWHLPSRKIEWIEPATSSMPALANSRYLIMDSRHQLSKIVIREYK